MASNTSNNNQGGGRGFAGMDPDRQREIASAGGKAAHESGNAHEFDSREAAEAGRKGGKASHGSRSRSSSYRGGSNRGGSYGSSGRDRDSQGRFD